jgi:hypothetical protein
MSKRTRDAEGECEPGAAPTQPAAKKPCTTVEGRISALEAEVESLKTAGAGAGSEAGARLSALEARIIELRAECKLPKTVSTAKIRARIRASQLEDAHAWIDFIEAQMELKPTGNINLSPPLPTSTARTYTWWYSIHDLKEWLAARSRRIKGTLFLEKLVRDTIEAAFAGCTCDFSATDQVKVRVIDDDAHPM